MHATSVRLRAAALMSTAAFGLHELRYLVGYQGDAAHALEQQGHAYMSVAGALVGLLLALAAAQLVARSALARRHRPFDERSGTLLRTWAAASGGLLLAYLTQESLEGFLASGHPSGLAGLLGHGGGWTVPLALALGALVVLLLRGARAAVLAAGGAAPARPRRRASVKLPRPALRPLAPTASLLSLHLAGRAPPLVA